MTVNSNSIQNLNITWSTNFTKKQNQAETENINTYLQDYEFNFTTEVNDDCDIIFTDDRNFELKKKFNNNNEQSNNNTNVPFSCKSTFIYFDTTEVYDQEHAETALIEHGYFEYFSMEDIISKDNFIWKGLVKKKFTSTIRRLITFLETFGPKRSSPPHFIRISLAMSFNFLTF